MKPVKVLFVTQWLEMYGATNSVTNLILDLKGRHNIEPFVLVPRQDIKYKSKIITEVLDENDIPYYSIYMESWRTTFPGQDFFHILYYKVRKIYRNIKLIKEFKNNVSFIPDVIYSNSSVIDVGIWLALYLHKPHMWHIREGEGSYHLQYIFPKKIVQRLFAKSDSVIAISKYIQSECQQMGIKCTCQIYNGINICLPYKKDYYNYGCVNFAVVGNLIAIKRQLDVIKAAKILKSKGFTEFKIYLIGDGEDRDLLEREVTSLELNQYVEFCGYIRDVQKLLQRMDVGITATSHEAFGLATVEYMMNYMPVIGNDSGATLEIIKDNEFGYLYHLGNVEELAACMEKFLTMNYMIGKMGMSARQEAEKYSVNNNTDNVYREIKRILRKEE